MQENKDLLRTIGPVFYAWQRVIPLIQIDRVVDIIVNFQTAKRLMHIPGIACEEYGQVLPEKTTG